MIDLNSPVFHVFKDDRRAGKTLEWKDTDTESLFKENLKKFGSSWHYAKTPVSYKYNSYGYRTVELNTLRDREFFLAMGCSCTEGIGVAEHERWSNILSSKINLESLNLGKGGAGPDFQYLNTLLFLKNLNIKPKFVVIQWPEITRTMFLSDNPSLLIPNNRIFKRELFFREHIKDNHASNYSFLLAQGVLLMWQMANVPVINFTLNGGWEEFDVKILPRFLPGAFENPLSVYGRDLLHPGLEMHNRIAEYIYGKIISN